MNLIMQTKEIYRVLAACSILAVMASLWLLAKRDNLSRTGIIGLAIVLLAAVNVLLFHGPLFFAISSKFLRGRDIGWRQEDALMAETYRFKKNVATDFLAVGSSQIRYIYTLCAKEETGLSVLAMAGMGPLDIVLYKNIIRSLCKHTVILTLSDFDLGRKPRLLGAKLAPPQGLDLPGVISLLRHESDITYAEIKDFVLANVIDPYRYQYIFRGYTDKAFGRNKAFPSEDISAVSAAENLRIQMDNLSRIDRKWFPINLLFLERFVTWASENNLKVVIVEGHYHPSALAANLALHTEASAKLDLLCRRFANCSYFRSDQIYEFTENDYWDGYHVREDAGRKFAQLLMDAIRPD